MPVRRHHHQQYCHHRDKHHDGHCHRHQHHHQQRHRHHRRRYPPPRRLLNGSRWTTCLEGSELASSWTLGCARYFMGPIDAALSELGAVMRYRTGRSVSGQRLRTVSQNSWKWSGTARCTASCVTRYQRTDIGEDEENPKNESPDDENFKP